MVKKDAETQMVRKVKMMLLADLLEEIRKIQKNKKSVYTVVV